MPVWSSRNANPATDWIVLAPQDVIYSSEEELEIKKALEEFQRALPGRFTVSFVRGLQVQGFHGLILRRAEWSYPTHPVIVRQ